MPTDPHRDLDAWLAALAAESTRPPDLPGDDPSALLPRWAALLADGAAPGADDAGLRAAMAEVADAVASSSGLAEVEPEPLRPAVRAAALEAFRAAARPCSLVAPVPPVVERLPRRVEPLRARRPARWTVPLQAAAVLLVALGAGLFLLLSGPKDATASLRIGAVYRVDLSAARPEIGSGRRLAPGETLASGPAEVVGLRLADGSTWTLEPDSALVVETDASLHAVLRLERGRAAVEAGPSGGTLRLPNDARVDVRAGAAWADAQEGVVVLAPAALGHLTLAGGFSRDLAGPVRVRIEGGRAEVEGDTVTGAFDVLALFRATPTPPHPGRLVEARRWRVVAGESRRTGPRLTLSGPRAEVAWRASPVVREARVLAIRLEAPQGTRIEAPALASAATVSGETLAASQGGRVVMLQLPEGWYARLDEAGQELGLRITWPDDSQDAVQWDGVTFVRPDEMVTSRPADR